MTRYHLYRPNWKSQYPFVLYLIPFILGILANHFFLFTDYWLLLYFFFLFFLFAFVFHLVRKKENWVSLIRSVSMYSCLFLLGCISASLADIRNHANWYGHDLKQAQGFELRIIKPPEEKEKTILIPVEVEAVYFSNFRKNARGKIKLYIYLHDSLPDFQIGSKIIIPNILTPIQDNGNPFHFQYTAYLQRNHIYHQAFLGKDDILYFPKTQQKTNKILRLRSGLFQSIEKNVEDSSTKAMISAMLLNDRSLLNNDLWQAYSVTGIAHIIAISGMHVSIFFGIFFFLLRWIKAKRWEWLKYLLAVPVIWLYVALTDFPPSAVRAAVMFSLIAFSLMLNRKTNNINTLAIAAFILLFYQPNWLYDTGVQLSFSAVLSIFIFYPPISKLWTPTYKVLSYLWNILAVSLAAQILVFPLVIYYFHQFPIWVLFANIPATFYSLALMVGSLLLFIFDAFLIPCRWLGDGLTMMTHLFHHIIYFFAQNTPKYMREFYLNELDFSILFLAVVSLSIYALRKNTGYLFSGLGLFCLLITGFIIQDYLALRQHRIVVYNIAGASTIDYFKGKKHQTYFFSKNQKLSDKSYRYNLFPSQLGYRAIKEIREAAPLECWEINHKKILFLNQNWQHKVNLSFPVDYLILSDACQFNPQLWHKAFEARQIILDGSFPRWKAIQWKRKLKANGIPVHWVQEDGAWVFAENLKK